MIPSEFNFLFQHVYYIYSEKEERIFNPYRVKNLSKKDTRNSKFHSNKNRNGFHERHSIFDIPRIEFTNPPAQGTIPDLPPLSRAPYLIIVQTILSCFLCGLKRNLVKPRLSYEVIRSRTIPPNFPLPSISLPLPLLSKISPRLSFVDAQPVAIREFIRRGSPRLEVLSSLHARSRENRSRGRRIRSGPICIRIDATRQFG